MIKYFNVLRPKTLIASISPVMIAYSLSKIEAIDHRQGYVFLCLVVGLLIQMSTNIFNDIYDSKTGVDEDRIGPARYTGNKIKESTLFRYAFLLIILSIMAGLPLIPLHWLYLPVGLISIYCSYGYTGGVYPIAYNGLGEFFAYLFFGWVAFIGTFYAISESITTNSLIFSHSIGMLSVILIYANNYRDKENDKRFKKNTIAVKFPDNAKNIFYLFIILSLIGKVFISFNFTYQLLVSIIPELALIFFLKRNKNGRFIFKIAIINYVYSTIVFLGFLA